MMIVNKKDGVSFQLRSSSYSKEERMDFLIGMFINY